MVHQKKINLKIALLLFSFFSVFLNAAYSQVAASAQEEFTDGPGLFYNYAPSYVQTSSTERYMCVCRNKDAANVKDHIMLRKSTLVNGTWVWGAPQVALAPSTNPNDWDALHTCDPEIRKSNVTYNGQNYTWVMFYLGVKCTCEKQNQVGVAFANSPEGPWVKYSGNPIVSTPSTDQWGVGQPTATNVDGNGRFLLFYTRSEAVGNGLFRKEINFSNMANPFFGPEVKVFTTGLTDADGSAIPSLQGAAISYEPNTDRFYMIRGYRFGGDGPDFISSQLELAYTSGSSIWNNSGTWTVDGYISPTNSGRAKNFDAGLLTDASGVLIGGANNYTPSYAISDLGGGFNWTYRIWRIAKSDLVANPNAEILPAGTYEIQPKHAPGKRLNETGLYPNANADIFSSNNSNAQKWKLIIDGGGYYQIEPQSDIGKRLDVAGAGTINGTNVGVWVSNNNNAQKWRIIAAQGGGGYYELEPKNAPGQRLDVSGAGTADNTNVGLFQQNGNDAQKWKITLIGGNNSAPQAGNIYELQPKHDLDNRLNESGNVPSGDARSLTTNNSNRQRWKLIDDGGGYYQLEPQSDIGKRLDVSGAGTTAGTDVAVWNENGNNAQKWKLIDAGNGWYELEPKNAPGLRLDVSGAGTGSDVNVYLWTQNGNDAQKWKFITPSGPAARVAPQTPVAELPLKNSISIYPNPSRDSRTLISYTSAVSTTLRVELYNAQGAIIKTIFIGTAEKNTITQLALNTSGFAAGTYLVRVVTKDGVTNKKLVIVK